MRATWILVGGLALVGASGPRAAQQTEYLTAAEVQEVRDTQEPNQRVKLFLGFADERLLRFEKALAPAPGSKPTHPDVLQDLLNNFINAVDDAAGTLEWALERGGVDLRKSRDEVGKRGEDFLARLARIQQSYPIAEGDLRYDLDDAVEATQDLLKLGKRIPDKPLPPKQPRAVGTATASERPAPAGRPTLKRREEKEKKKDNKPQ